LHRESRRFTLSGGRDDAAGLPDRTARRPARHRAGTNHLGHFALTGLALPCLTAAPAARVVMVTSDAHARDTLDLTDLDWQRRRYRPMAAYAQSKQANLLFAYELQRRLAAAASPVTSSAPPRRMGIPAAVEPRRGRN
jgi:NAD(P)-dependent dehydrogenase (short-subunit alcohol dehydrogenase family)